MAQTTINRLIINSPYEEPAFYWNYDREARLFDLVSVRSAGATTPGIAAENAAAACAEAKALRESVFYHLKD